MVLRAILGAIRINIRRRIHKENRSLWQHQFEKKKQSSSSITIQSIRRPLKNQKRVKKRVLGRHISSPPSRAGWITKSNQPRGDHKSNSDSARGARIVLGCIIHACSVRKQTSGYQVSLDPTDQTASHHPLRHYPCANLANVSKRKRFPPPSRETSRSILFRDVKEGKGSVSARNARSP